ncbi:hypothetical protein Hanom_Chr11g01024401 [Helianthus anomalus]
MVRLRCPPFQWVTSTLVVRYLGFGNLLSGVAGVVIGRLEGFMCLNYRYYTLVSKRFNFGLLFASAEHIGFHLNLFTVFY